MKLYRVLLVALLLILQGCSMLSPSDPRTAKQQWLDQHSLPAVSMPNRDNFVWAVPE